MPWPAKLIKPAASGPFPDSDSFRIPVLLAALVLIAILSGGDAWAHTLFMNVDDNEDGTVTVEGLYSTGAMAAYTPVLLKDANDKVIWKGKTDEFGQCQIPKPNEPYTIFMDGGPGHRVEEAGPPRKTN